MNEERFWFLVSLKVAGEASAEELDELGRLSEDHPELDTRLVMLNNVWVAKHSGLISRKDEAYDKHLQRLSNHFSEPVLQYASIEPSELVEEEIAQPSKKYKWIWWPAAAAASLVIMWFSFFKTGTEKKEEGNTAKNTISTKRGSKSKVQLPDGTQVWLNADSKISYSENFQGKLREVQLTGEAFFDVVRDESRPFIIHTNTIDVKVLGTAFNVRSYANEKNTETSLIRGSVEITLVRSPDMKKIILKPNDKLIVNNQEGTLVQGGDDKVKHNSPVLTLGKVHYKEKDSIAVETLWIKNKLAFDKETLEDIALKIERWYDVKLVITDERLKKESYTATFEDETLQEVMAALKEGGGFNFSINKKEVMISPDK